MSKTAIISARIDPKLKNNAERVFKRLGLTTTQAITLFYEQVVGAKNGLPFQAKIPNRATRKALDDAKARRNLESFNSPQELFESLNI
ncbi:type II toxin-antitoxin system RelB/DinJ family antitoxin [candidate division KSB1 bacterium]|nr:type II toxin-antitoxin system RelB/DinJ family antitoxin [candidate division KSB1 bacterium]